jgi:PhnB protein
LREDKPIAAAGFRQAAARRSGQGASPPTAGRAAANRAGALSKSPRLDRREVTDRKSRLVGKTFSSADSTPAGVDAMQVQPYLFFEGRCEEAIEFYKRALGAEVQMLMRYRDSPEAPPPGMVPPGSGDKVMHAELRIGDTIVMVSDGGVSGKPSFAGFSLAIAVRDPAEADGIFNRLADGGQVQMPLGQTFWSLRFGMLADRFGVNWMVNTVAQ